MWHSTGSTCAAECSWGVLGREPLPLGPKSPLTSVMAWLVEVLPSVPSMERMRSVSTTLYGLSRLYYLEGAPLPPHLQSLVAKLVALAAQPERRMQRSSASTSLAAAPADLPLQLSSASIIAVSLGIMGMEVREGSWQGLLDPVLAPRPGVRMNPERCSQLLMGLAVVGQRSQLAVPAAVRILADLLQAVEETPLETLSRASWSAALIQVCTRKIVGGVMRVYGRSSRAEGLREVGSVVPEFQGFLQRRHCGV